MFVVGVWASTGYALATVSTEMKTVYIASIPAADDLTQRQADKYPYLIRTGWSSSQPHHPLGQWACEQGYKKIVFRRLRWENRAKDLAAARYEGFWAFYSNHQS